MSSSLKRIAEVSPLCVACGVCVSVCKFQAISIRSGIRAVVDTNRCKGCGRCSTECPANVISIGKEHSDEN